MHLHTTRHGSADLVGQAPEMKACISKTGAAFGSLDLDKLGKRLLGCMYGTSIFFSGSGRHDCPAAKL